jgi:hypothetical protein
MKMDSQPLPSKDNHVIEGVSGTPRPLEAFLVGILAGEENTWA